MDIEHVEGMRRMVEFAESAILQKARLRAKIAADIELYLRNGGTITEIKDGESSVIGHGGEFLQHTLWDARSLERRMAAAGKSA